jgi:hypothetical protein
MVRRKNRRLSAEDNPVTLLEPDGEITFLKGWQMTQS